MIFFVEFCKECPVRLSPRNIIKKYCILAALKKSHCFLFKFFFIQKHKAKDNSLYISSYYHRRRYHHHIERKS